jgi:hypothetical protein
VKEVVPELRQALCREGLLELFLDDGVVGRDGPTEGWRKYELQRLISRRRKQVRVADQEGPEVVCPGEADKLTGASR